MDIYDKGEQEDLSGAQKKFLRALAERYEREAIRFTRGNETP